VTRRAGSQGPNRKTRSPEIGRLRASGVAWEVRTDFLMGDGKSTP
jgi:hypothetical protein